MLMLIISDSRGLLTLLAPRCVFFYTLSTSMLWIIQDYRFCYVLSFLFFFLSRRFSYISSNNEKEDDDEDDVDDNNHF